MIQTRPDPFAPEEEKPRWCVSISDQKTSLESFLTVWKISGQSGKFWEVWKVSGQSRKFLESFQTIQKACGQFGKFPDSLESFVIVL